MLQLFRSNRGVQNFHPDSLNLLNFLICVLLLLTPVIPGEKKKTLVLPNGGWIFFCSNLLGLYHERLFNFLNQLDMGLCVK